MGFSPFEPATYTFQSAKLVRVLSYAVCLRIQPLDHEPIEYAFDGLFIYLSMSFFFTSFINGACSSVDLVVV